MSRAFENASFHFLGIFWVTKLKSFSGKVRRIHQNCPDQKFVIGSILEKSFEGMLRSKTNVLSVWIQQFFLFSNMIWVEKLTPFSGKRRNSFENCSNRKFEIELILENVLSATFSSKRMLWAFGNGLFHFLANFSMIKSKPILGDARQCFESSLSQVQFVKNWL